MKVTVSIATSPQLFPPGTVAGQFRVTINGGDPAFVDSQDGDGPDFVFGSVPDGDFTATSQRLAADGSDLGSPASASFTVSTPTDVSIDVPTAMTVTLDPDAPPTT